MQASLTFFRWHHRNLGRCLWFLHISLKEQQRHFTTSFNSSKSTMSGQFNSCINYSGPNAFRNGIFQRSAGCSPDSSFFHSSNNSRNSHSRRRRKHWTWPSQIKQQQVESWTAELIDFFQRIQTTSKCSQQSQSLNHSSLQWLLEIKTEQIGKVERWIDQQWSL